MGTTPSAPTEPRVVRGGGHVAVYWADPSGGHYRFFQISFAIEGTRAETRKAV